MRLLDVRGTDQDIEEVAPYLDAVAVAAEMFDWDEDEVELMKSDFCDHTPWALNPIFSITYENECYRI